MSQNEVIGTWKCDGGGVADVMQTKRRGKHFYTKCTCCGLLQGTGAAFQSRIWSEADFKAGVSVIKPSNVTERETEKPVNESPADEVPTVEAEEVDETGEEYSPHSVDANSAAKEAPPSKAGFGLLAGLVLVASGVGGFLWTNKPKI